MEKLKIYPVLCALSAMMLYSNTVKAQWNAQNDLFGVLQNSCSHYLDVKANDSLPNNSFQLQILSQPQNGTVSVNGNYISYCPQSGYLGADVFKYLVTDSTQFDSAAVYINVVPYNNFVFAGDADQNGRVENFDVLALGLAYNLSGPSRFDSLAINSLAWNPSSYLNSNPGAADCNGDGIVDDNDLIAIENAYHQISPILPAFEIDTSSCLSNSIPFFITALTGDTVVDGDTLDLAIKLGADFTLNEAYGIAFTLEIDTSVIPANLVLFNTSNSWLLQNDAGLFFKKSFQATGEIEIALTKTNHQPSNGEGELLRTRLPIDDNIDGIITSPGSHHLNIRLKNVRLISPYNIVGDVCVQQPSLTYYKNTVGVSHVENHLLKVYPNPANNIVFIEAENIREVEITDIAGRKVYGRYGNPTSRMEIKLNELSMAGGTYFVKIKTTEFVSTRKIFVQH